MIGFPKALEDLFPSVSENDLAKSLKQQRTYYHHEGLPEKGQKEWQHFPFHLIKKAGYMVSKECPLVKNIQTGFPPLHPRSLQIVLNNGVLSSKINKKGISVFSWRDVLQNKTKLEPKVKEFILQSLKEKRNGLCSLNNIFSHHGLVIFIEKDLDQDLEIQYNYDSLKQNQAENLRNFIFVKEQVKVNLFEVFYGSRRPQKNPSDSVLFNLQTDYFLSKGARLNCIRVDRARVQDVHFNHTFSRMEPDSESQMFTVNLGSGISRYFSSFLQKKGSSSQVRGVSPLGANQHTHHKVEVQHEQEDTCSRQRYISLLFDESSYIFNGLIRINKQAQKSDAHQFNQNFILGEKALALSSPELDVKADDVKAFHGSSTSSIEESQQLLFYLRSRGLSSSDALDLVFRALLKDVLSSLDLSHKQTVEPLIFEHLKKFKTSLSKEA